MTRTDIENFDGGDGWMDPDSPEAIALQERQAGAERDVKKSASTMLVEIAEKLYDFHVSTNDETFAVPKRGPRVAFTLRGGKKSLRAQLSREYFQGTGKAAPQQALADALLVVEGLAQDSDHVPLHLRVARHGTALWLDLGDDTGRAAKITGTGWTIESSVPVFFKRTALNGPLPTPERGGNLDLLWRWLNVEEEDRPLVIAWLASIFYPDIPHPVPGLFGEQGTGKTTAEKLLVSIVDPGPAPTRKPPRDAEAWVTAASGSWIVGIDNLSTIPDWLSDAICRAVTGEGDVRRKLYTDGDLAVFAFKRCVILGGIDVGAIRGDLADRLLPLTLHTIGDADRLEEEELWPAWAEMHPGILGAVLDEVASVMAVLHSVRLESKPRMADFARVLAAVDQVRGTSGLRRYMEKQSEVATESLTDDSFVTTISTTLKDVFIGTSAELLALVTPADEKWRAPKGWPGSSRQVTQTLRRQAPSMRKAGWQVDDDGGANKQHTVTWTIAPRHTEMVCNGDSPCSPCSPTSPTTTQASQASQASMEYGPSPYEAMDRGPVRTGVVVHGGPQSAPLSLPVDDGTRYCTICGMRNNLPLADGEARCSRHRTTKVSA